MSIEWKTYKLGNICDYVTSRTTRIENYISTENMLPNKGGVCAPSNVPSGTAIEYKVGDILISNIRPYFQKIWQADCNGACSADVLCIRANNKADSKYLYYLLSQQLFFDYVMAGAKGCKMPRGDKKQIMQWQISLPSLEEQRRIAGILGAIDDKIENNRRINTNLELQAQALYKQWFVDFDFPNEEGKPYKSSGGKMVDSELGPIPDGWRVQTFGDLIKPQKGKNITRAQVTIGSVPVVAGGLMPSCYHNTSNTHCPVVTISASGANAGYVKMYHMPIWAADCSYIDDTISKYVHFAYVFLTYNQTSIYHKQQGCAQPHIYPSHLMELQFICPTLDILDKFESWSKKIYKLIGTNIQEIETLATLRDTLLPKLMNGEIKL